MNPVIASPQPRSEEQGESPSLLAVIRLDFQAVEQALKSGDLDQAELALVKLADHQFEANQLQQASQNARQVVEQGRQGPAEIDALLILAHCAAREGDLDCADATYHRAAELSRLQEDKTRLASAWGHLGINVHLLRGNFDLALYYAENARSLIKKNAPDDLWLTLYLAARVHHARGDGIKMRQALDEMLPLVKPATRIAGAYFLLWSQLSLDEEEMEKASEYLRLALRIADQTGDPFLIIVGRIEQSRFLRLGNNSPAGFAWAEEALKHARRLNIRSLEGLALVELALLAWQANQHQSAQQTLAQARAILEPMKAACDTARIAFYQAAISQECADPQAETRWIEAANLILAGNFTFILESEREIAYPLLSFHHRSHTKPARQASETLINQLSKLAPPRLRIYGLGQFTVWQGRHRIPDPVWQRRRAGDLFRYLLLRPDHSASRDKILDDLLGESDPDKANDLFHQATSTLRHILEPDLPDKYPSRYLKVEGERVFLNLPPGTQIDYEQFELDVQRSLANPRIDVLEQTLASYLDDLFPMDRYKDWTAARRESVAELRLGGILALGKKYLSTGQDVKALGCARQALTLDSWNEDAALLGMMACKNLGDKPRAIRIYQEIEKTLLTQLEIEPRADLQKFFAQLRSSKT